MAVKVSDQKSKGRNDKSEEFPLSGLLEYEKPLKEPVAERLRAILEKKSIEDIEGFARSIAELAHVGGNSAGASKILRGLLNKGNGVHLRVFAVNGLARLLELGSAHAKNAVADALADPVQETREAAATALLKASSLTACHSPELMAILRVSLSDESIYVKEKVALSLSNIGSKGELEAISMLTKALDNPNFEDRLIALRALSHLSASIVLPEKSVEALSRLIESEEDEIRKKALIAIGNAAEKGVVIRQEIAERIKSIALSEESEGFAHRAYEKICLALEDRERKEAVECLSENP